METGEHCQFCWATELGKGLVSKFCVHLFCFILIHILHCLKPFIETLVYDYTLPGQRQSTDIPCHLFQQTAPRTAKWDEMNTSLDQYSVELEFATFYLKHVSQWTTLNLEEFSSLFWVCNSQKKFSEFQTFFEFLTNILYQCITRLWALERLGIMAGSAFNLESYPVFLSTLIMR